MNELSYEAGITLPIPGTKFGMSKPSVRFTIDVEGDIDAQIEQHKKALEKLAPAVEESLAQELANITGLNVEGYGVAEKVKGLEQRLDFIVTEMKRQKEVLEDIVGAKQVDKPAVRGGKRKKE
ncbi:hypothetical protein LCGC14_1848380 [marine sediment metagenome]|uniref:Uncharacterized protein n=1 Tax=marine sediment metagenome TaxID=412755 RepID=A0A0F9JAC2_9ZZZZ